MPLQALQAPAALAAETSVSGTGGSTFVVLPGARLLSPLTVPARGVVSFPVTGRAGVPAEGVSSVQVSVTTSRPTSGGGLTVFATGTAMPAVTSVTLVAGVARTATVAVSPGTAGQASIANASSSPVTVAIDVHGYAAAPGAPSQGGTFREASARALNTTSGAAVGSNRTVTAQVLGIGGVPTTGVRDVVLEVTALRSGAHGTATAYPNGSTRPAVTHISFVKGQQSTAMVTVRPGTSGRVALWNGSAAGTHFLVDVVGYHARSGATFVPVTPTRVGSSVVAARGTSSFAVGGAGPVPADGVSAAVVSLSAVGPSAAGALTAFPSGKSRPSSLSASFSGGRGDTQAVIVPLGTSGRISVHNSAGISVRVTADVLGYLGPDTAEPSTVSALKAHSTAGPTMLLSWVGSVSEDVAALHIRRRSTAVSPGTLTEGTSVATLPRSATSYQDAGVTNGTTYSYSVFAIDGAGNPSRPAEVTQSTPLGPITGFEAAAASGSVALTWRDSADPRSTGVLIRRSLGRTPPATRESGELVAHVSKGTQRAVDGNLLPDTTYSYTAWSNEANETYGPPVSLTVTTAHLPHDVTPPGPVTRLEASPYGADLKLSWSNPLDGDLAGVVIRRSWGTEPPQSRYSGTEMARLEAPAASWVDGTVVGGETYAYSVFAFDDRGNYAAGASVVGTAAQEPHPVRVCGTIDSDQTWGPSHSRVYIVDCPVVIARKATLTLEPGTIVKVKRSVPYWTPSLEVRGALLGRGTSSEPVTLTSLLDDTVGGDTNGDGNATSPAEAASGTKYWGHIAVSTPYPGDTPGVLDLDNVRVRWTWNIQAHGPSALRVSRSVIEHTAVSALAVTARTGSTTVVESTEINQSGGHGIEYVQQATELQRAPASAPTVTGNHVVGAAGAAVAVNAPNITPQRLTGNTGSANRADVVMVSGTLVEDLALPMPGLPWAVGSPGQRSDGSLAVDPEATLTLKAGAVLKMAAVCLTSSEPGPGCQGSLRVHGSLVGRGSPTDPAVITSLHDDSAGGDSNNDGTGTAPQPEDWQGITTSLNHRGPSRIDLQDTHISYARWLDVSGPSQTSIVRSAFRDMTVRVIPSLGSPVRIEDNLLVGAAGEAIHVRIDVHDTATAPIVRQNSVRSGASRAISVFANRLVPELLGGNSGADDGRAHLAIGGTLVSDLTLPTAGLPWVVDTSLTVGASATLRMNAGAGLKFRTCRPEPAACQHSTLQVAGALVVRGSVEDPVWFTSLPDDSRGGDTNGDGAVTSPTRSDWGGITLGRTGFGPEPVLDMEHGEIAHGYGISGWTSGQVRVVSSSFRGAAVNATASGKIELTDNTVRGAGLRVVSDLPPRVARNVIEGATDAAISIETPRLDPELVTDNVGAGTGVNAIVVTGSLAADLRLPRAGLPWVVGGSTNEASDTPRGGLTVPAGRRLDLGPGAVLKITGSLVVKGSFSSSATPEQPAFVTSLRNDVVGGDTNADLARSQPHSRDWGRIRVTQDPVGTAPIVDLHDVDFSYGGGIISQSLAVVKVRNSSFRHMSESAIYLEAKVGSTTIIENVEVEDVGGVGIDVWMDPRDLTNASVLRDSTVTGARKVAMRVSGRLDPARLSGNSASGNGRDVLSVSGTLVADLTVPTSGLPWVVGGSTEWYPRAASSESLTVPPGVTLTVPAGVALKLEATCRSGESWRGCAGLVVQGTLRTTGTPGQPAVITSVRDDSVGGDTNGDGSGSAPSAGDWQAISVEHVEHASAPVLDLQGVHLRYATTALVVPSGSYSVTGQITDDAFGIAGPPRSPDGTCPHGTVTATGIWWGTPTGPQPHGTGPGVSGCVDVQPHAMTPGSPGGL